MTIHQRATLYILWDTLAGDIVGNILALRSDAAAVRLFTDVLNAPDSVTAAHPEDYDLVQLGVLIIADDEDDPNKTSIRLVPDFRVVIKGATIIELRKEHAKN